MGAEKNKRVEYLVVLMFSWLQFNGFLLDFEDVL
jgi:hypothetical protein